MTRLVFFAAILCCVAHAQTRRAVLGGNVPQALRGATDLGRVAPDLSLPSLRISLKIPAEKQAALDRLLAAQQDPTSPEYRKWLTPEMYAARFGAPVADITEVSNWLVSRGFAVTRVARARNAISFTGSVAQVEAAFDTELHRYSVKGETHFSNASEPSVPVTLERKIGAIHGLNDFRLKPRFTLSTGANYLAPDDFATIYNVKPLYAEGITGAGQKVVVVGQTRVTLADLQQFRTTFNLPPKDPELVLVPNLKDPGVSTADVTEALLDIDWVGAVARDATVLYVYSEYVTDALGYAIDENLAPVLSMSYGLCESDIGASDARIFRTYSQQAALQGITWVAASGDAGAADCYNSNSRTASDLGVDIPASLPEVTSLGGTRFDEGSGTYWNTMNDPNGASVLSYIPEVAWNDVSSGSSRAASGGGASMFFGKPCWQTGTPVDGARDVPDVSLSASAQHVGYIIYKDGSRFAVGGTSAAAPPFAGLVALLNQSQPTSGLGNINPRLYALAATAPSAFHDITMGNNIVDPCSPRVALCTAERIGFNAGVGYDQVTGLGTIDAFNLATAWADAGAAGTPVVLSLAALTQGSEVALIAKVSGVLGGTPTGAVSFVAGSTVLGTATLSGGTATLILPATKLAGAGAITAKYADRTSAAVFLDIGIAGAVNAASFKPMAAPGMILAVYGGLMAAETQSASLPLPITLGGVSATINDVACPLYYVSPTQINLQVPPSASPGPATLRVTYNGRTATSSLTIAPAAPGVFMDFETNAPAPDEVAKRGQTVSLYVTGNNGQQPIVTVGGVPANLTYWGVPSWSVGVTQINYTVPPNAPLGRAPAVVTAGGTASAPIYLIVTQ